MSGRALRSTGFATSASQIEASLWRCAGEAPQDMGIGKLGKLVWGKTWRILPEVPPFALPEVLTCPSPGWAMSRQMSLKFTRSVVVVGVVVVGSRRAATVDEGDAVICARGAATPSGASIKYRKKVRVVPAVDAPAPLGGVVVARIPAKLPPGLEEASSGAVAWCVAPLQHHAFFSSDQLCRQDVRSALQSNATGLGAAVAADCAIACPLGQPMAWCTQHQACFISDQAWADVACSAAQSKATPAKSGGHPTCSNAQHQALLEAFHKPPTAPVPHSYFGYMFS
mmetsp:Transcript_35041/g.100917  ORF Transcript_35041/g.100917 Transcript_35041/m.100917 type:complete len:283 (-) Transcript_35041:1052-1900(-)